MQDRVQKCLLPLFHPPSLSLSHLTLSLFPSPPLLVPSLSYEEEQEELWCNYERYRTLVQNAFRGISEEKCLKEMEIEDMYPETKKKPNKEKAKYECCHECDSSILPNPIPPFLLLSYTLVCPVFSVPPSQPSPPLISSPYIMTSQSNRPLLICVIVSILLVSRELWLSC